MHGTAFPLPLVDTCSGQKELRLALKIRGTVSISVPSSSCFQVSGKVYLIGKKSHQRAFIPMCLSLAFVDSCIPPLLHPTDVTVYYSLPCCIAKKWWLSLPLKGSESDLQER